MGINIKHLKGFDVKRINDKKEPEKRFDVVIIEIATGRVVVYYQRDMPESRAINYQRKAYEGLGSQTDYLVELVERKPL